MGAASAFTVTTSFAALTTTPGLPTATASTTPAMPVTAMAAAGVKHLAEHPNERTMQAARNITETGVNFTDSIVACNVCKIKKGTKQPIHNKPDKTEIPERLQLFSTDLLGHVTPTARGNYRFLVKCSDHYTKFKAVYLFLKKDKSLATLVKLVQDFVIPLRLGLLHLRADSGGDFTVDYYHDYYKTTMIIQQFSSPNTSEQNGLSEREAQGFGGKWRPPRFSYSTARRARASAATRRTTRCSANTSTCYFSRLLEPVHMRAVKRILC